MVYLTNAVETYCKEINYQHVGRYYKWNSYSFDENCKIVLWEYWPDAYEALQEAYASEELMSKYPEKFGGTVHRPEFLFFRCRKVSLL